MINLLKAISNKQRTRQVLMLYSGTIIQLALGMITSVVIARALRPEQYGHYGFIFNFINLILIIVSSGHFVSISMILAQSGNESNKRSILGASFLINLFVSCIFSAIVFVYTFFHGYIFHNMLAYPLRLLALPLIFFPMQVYLEAVLMGLNRIKLLTVMRVLPKALYLIAALLLIQMDKLNYFTAIMFMLLTSYVVYIGNLIFLKPNFTNLSRNLHYIEAENKRYGFQVYVGSLCYGAAIYLCTLSIGYFTNNTDLGFFNLALTVATPLFMLPNVIATTFFRNFADAERIPDKLIRYTIVLSVASYIVFALCIKEIVLFLYSAEYIQTVMLAYILGFGMIVTGIADVFNRFLSAKALGKVVRNANLIGAGVCILSLFVLVPIYGSSGAAVTRLLVAIAYLSAMYAYYRKALAMADHGDVSSCAGRPNAKALSAE